MEHKLAGKMAIEVAIGNLERYTKFIFANAGKTAGDYILVWLEPGDNDITEIVIIRSKCSG